MLEDVHDGLKLDLLDSDFRFPSPDLLLPRFEEVSTLVRLLGLEYGK